MWWDLDSLAAEHCSYNAGYHNNKQYREYDACDDKSLNVPLLEVAFSVLVALDPKSSCQCTENQRKQLVIVICGSFAHVDLFQ